MSGRGRIGSSLSGAWKRGENGHLDHGGISSGFPEDRVEELEDAVEGPLSSQKLRRKRAEQGEVLARTCQTARPAAGAGP